MPTIVEQLTAVVRADISNFKSGMMNVTNLSKRAGAGMAKAGKIGFIAFTGLGLASLKFASDFDKAMAEVDTIAGKSVDQMKVIRKEILTLSESMGKDPTKLAKGFYQTISAGITNTSDAMIVMRKSVKLAVAGLASQETTVDVVTSALNAYNLSASSAERITDALFTTVRLGKTRLEPLAASLGRILPIAASLGVEIEEVGANIVGLTAAGLSTQEAVTGLRQLFVSILKPTQEAAAEAQRVGLAWDVAAIKSKGFGVVMADLNKLLLESDIDIAKLIPNIRALPAALLLAGSQAGRVSNAMRAMLKNLGVTETAFQKMEETLSRKLEKAMAGIRVTLVEIGTTLTPVAIDMLAWMRDTAKGMAQFIRLNPKLVSGTIKWGIAISGTAFALGKLVAVSKTLVVIYGAIAGSSTIAALSAIKLTASVSSVALAMKGLTLTVGGLAALTAGLVAFGAAVVVAFAGFKAGNLIYDKFVKSSQEAFHETRRLAREQKQASEASATFARGFATRQLKRAGHLDLEKKSVTEITKIYKQWFDSGNQLSQVLGKLGVDQERINQIRSSSTIPQIKEMITLGRTMRNAELARSQIIESNIQKISQLTTDQVRLTQQATDTARGLYQVLTEEVSNYQDAIEQAMGNERRLADQRRQLAEGGRGTIIDLEISRGGVSEAKRTQTLVQEAERAQRLAAEATKAGDASAAQDFIQKSKQLFTRVARDRISAEKTAMRELEEIRKRARDLSFQPRTRANALEQKGLQIEIKQRAQDVKTIGGEIDALLGKIQTVQATRESAIISEQIAAKRKTEEAKLSLADLQNQIEMLKMTASDLSINLETQTAQERLDALVTKFRTVRSEIKALGESTISLQAGNAAGRAQGIPGVGAIGAPAGGPVTNNVTQTVNVNGITDPDEVAKKVVAILDKRERRRQSSGSNVS